MESRLPGRRIKVCHVIPTLDQGGAEKQLCLLAGGMDTERFETHVVVLTHSGPREAELRARGVPVHAINKRGKFDFSALSRLTKLLRELQPQIVHTWLFAANCYGRYAAVKAGVPVIIAGERCVDPWKSWWHGALDRYFLKHTRTIVTNTTAVVDFYARRGIGADRFTVIPNGVELPVQNRLSRAEVFSRLNIDPTEKLVIAVGRLWPQKGYRELIWAGELLRTADPQATFVIIGDGPEREQLLHYRDQVLAQHAVRLVGHRTDAAELMSGADVLWNGSLYEGQSNTILEAMALGIPVIASDIPGNRDLVVPGETGFLFRLGDAAQLTKQTCSLFSDAAKAEAMGAAARSRVATAFSVDQMVRKHETLYQNTVA